MSIDINVGRRAAPAGFSPFFSDNFNRANTSQGIGPNWIQNLRRNTGSACVISANRLQLVAVPALSVPPCALFPWRPMLGLWGQPQFVQIQFVAGTFATTTTEYGPTVMMSPDVCLDLTAYGARVTMAAGPTQTLSLVVYTAPTALVVLAGPFPLAPLDTIRLSVVPAPAGNLLTMSVNGVQVAQLTDATAGRPIGTGSPGMFGNTMFPTAITTWDNFACGPGA